MKKSSSLLPRLAITLGDPNGIGPELLLRSFQDEALFRLMRPVLYGPFEALDVTIESLGLSSFSYQRIENASEMPSSGVGLVNVSDSNFLPTPGTPTQEGARLAYRSLEKACQDLSIGRVDALVTCPLSKESFSSTPYRGHTEYLAARFRAAESLMLLLGDSLRVALCSTHVPLSAVPSLLSEELLRAKHRLLQHTLVNDLGIQQPKVALLSLNPHAGEGGLIGKEEEELLFPFVRAEKKAAYLLRGPYAADGFFGSRVYREFDAVLALYHDQGLLPFKMCCFDTGVNFTAGLPIVRTSPAHGTAYEIVGQGKALVGPLRAAIRAAAQIFQTRKQKPA